MSPKDEFEREIGVLRAELAASNEREERFRRLFNNMVEGFGLAEILLDEQGRPNDYRFLEVNAAFGRLTGFAPEKVKGRTVRELIPDIEPIWIENYGRVVATGEPTRFESYSKALGKWFEVFAYRTGPGRFAHLFIDITDRKHLEERRQESEAVARREAAELTLVYESAPVGLCLLDRELRYLRVNQQLAEMNGLSIEEHIGKTPRDVVPEIADHAEPLLRRVLETGEPSLGLEFTGHTAARPGEERAWIENIHALKDESGQVIALNIMVEEVTERRLVEAARQREASFWELAEHLPDIVARVDCDLHYLYVNPAMESTMGVSREALLGKADQHLEPSRNLTHILEESISGTFESGLEDHVEFSIETRPKGVRRFEARIVPEFGPDRRVATVLVVSRDITEHKRLQQGLSQVNAELEARETSLAESQRLAHVGSWEWDIATDEFHWSDETFRIAGYAPQSFRVTLKSVIGAVHPEDRRRVSALASRAEETGEGYQDEHRIVRPDGSVRTIECRGEAVRDPQGEVVALRGTWIDITERRQAQDALERLVQSIPEGMLVLDFDGNVLFANLAAQRMLGKPDAELKDTSLGFPLTTGEWAEITLTRPDRTQLLVEMRIVEIDWRDQRALAASLYDITEHRALERERIEHLHRLQGALFQTVQAVSSTVGKRDPYTAGHQVQVARLAAAIGEEMGLPKEQVQGLRLGAAIIDIGKISIPAEILNRPGHLSPEQSALVESHSETGYEILRDVDFPWPIAEMIREHHERLDGSGYPQGLKDGEICLEGRILAVADALSALVSHRPYRPAMEVDVAIAEITSGRGTRFDPEVVDACVRLLRDRGFELIPEGERPPAGWEPLFGEDQDASEHEHPQ